MLTDTVARRAEKIRKESASPDQCIRVHPYELAERRDEGRSERKWLAEKIGGLTDEIERLSPSQWAERTRYLPPHTTPMPGYYSFDVVPYMREVVDCLGEDSPVREVAVMKGSQLAYTVGVLENAIGYMIDHVRTAPVMLVTADAELAKLRLESNIIPMLQASGLMGRIQSQDQANSRKTGKTDKKVEWSGGGYFLPLGAQNANKLRSTSIRILLNDEIDAWPDELGREGDPLAIVKARTSGFEGSRKIAYGSTPLVKGMSKIEERFKRGDQRYYFVKCLGCGLEQRLRWRRVDRETGEESGIVWEMDGGRLVPGSVRYVCKGCGRRHTNDEKTKLLSPAHGAKWVPTAVPDSPAIRSYHISALYSPVGMKSWESCVEDWLAAWDVEKNKPKDLGKLQFFYNHVLGETYEIRGERVRFEAVSSHRRPWYSYGQIPNKWTERFCGGPVLFLACTVDVHSDVLNVAVFGWCRDRRAVLVEYLRLEGDTEQLDSPAWKALEELLEQKEWQADDGKRYRVLIALIDSGYRAEQVYRFCAEYPQAHVYPIKGREAPAKGATVREFSEFVPKPGQRGYHLTVDYYKDRWSAALRHPWDGVSRQPTTFFNAPGDATDKQLKELTVEVKRERIEKTTGRRVGFEWHRPSGAANELWDLLVYADAALDIVAHGFSREAGFEFTNWSGFYDAASRGLFFRAA